jgi:glycosyltransferase involved in cell wall biosynthesis
VRVLQLVSAFAWSGPAEPTVVLAQGLAARGHDVTVGHDTVRPGGNEHEEGMGPRVAATGLPVARELKLCTRGGPLDWARDVAALRRRYASLEVVHTHFSYDHVVAQAARVGRERPVLVRTVHADRSLRPRPFQGALLAAADATVLLTHDARRRAEGLGVPRERLHVMPGIVDLQRFHLRERRARAEAFRRRHGLPVGVRALGMVAIFQRGRGHDQAVRAWAEAAPGLPGVELWLAGLGEERPAVMAWCQENRVPGVRFLGYVKEDLEDLYAALDATLILAVGNDGYGRAALESMATGTPVVAARIPPLAEAVEDAGAGLLVEPGNHAGLVAALTRVGSLPAGELDGWGLTARRGMEGQRSAARLVDLTLGLYGTLLAARG